MYELSEIGNLVVVIAGALGSLLLIVFKSRCKSICFGCITRDVINSDNEDEPTVPPTSSEQVPLTNP
tara:strand:+ start:273 stop:473 length:201 start_codon:yes stop_codon:yes gene_type:complete